MRALGTQSMIDDEGMGDIGVVGKGVDHRSGVPSAGKSNCSRCGRNLGRKGHGWALGQDARKLKAKFTGRFDLMALTHAHLKQEQWSRRAGRTDKGFKSKRTA